MRTEAIIRSFAPVLRASVLVGVLGAFGSASAQLPGAIFTSTKTGTTVNGNIYNDEKDVYLNGGPQNPNGSLLMDGIYFFQVTDPSGKTLLHKDSAWDRLVLVDGGRFAGRCNSSGTLLSMGPPKPPHPNGIYNPTNGGVPVQLWPYDPTPNNGGEYKAWLVLWKPEVTDSPKTYSSTTYSTPDTDGVHLVFSRRWCKTDNYKVKVKTGPPNKDWVLQALKFYDTNMDGVWDPSELPIMDFGITFELNGGAPAFKLTLANGTTDVVVPNGTTYRICEVLPPNAGYNAVVPAASTGWFQTGPGGFYDAPEDRCYSGTATSNGTFYFGNIQMGRLSGVKFYDTNGNGEKDPGEPGLAGFKIKIEAVWPDGSDDGETITSGADGSWVSKRYPDGTDYTVYEDLSTFPTWLQTSTPATYTGTIEGTKPTGNYHVSYTIPDKTGLDFGNVRTCRFEGVKFYDRDMDGIQDASEPGVGGITIHLELTLPDGTETSEDVVTAADGSWETANLYPDGTTYEISEVLPTTPGCWIQTAPAGGKYTGTLSGDGNPTDATYELNCDEFNFGNILGAKLCGKKVYDADFDGVVDPEDPGIQGFKITIEVTLPNGDVETETVYTGPGGTYCTVNCYPEGSTYEVCEVAPSSAWIQTFPANDECYEGTIPTSTGPYDAGSSLPDVEGLVFANIVLGGEGGHTPGYWHNQNGEETMMDGGTLQPELNALIALPLRNEDGSNAYFASFQEFSDWLVSTDGVNMANKLSSHVAAMFLNIEAGFVNAGSYIYAPGTTSAGPLGFAEVGDVLAEAIAALEADGYTPSGDEPMRSYQTALKDALDKANNNTNWVSGPITIIPSPY